MTDALLVLEDGRTFSCRSFTGPGEAWGETVFNTGMTGYQEVLTDPSYRGQMITMTAPLIGNTGVNPEDVESDRVQVSAFIIREYEEIPSSWRSTGTLAAYLQEYGVMGVEGLDTRSLTRHLRTAGALRGIISTTDTDPASLLKRVQETPGMAGRDLVSRVTTGRPYRWTGENRVEFPEDVALGPDLWRKTHGCFSVVVLDFGVKYNILRRLESAGCDLIVVPADTTAETVLAMKPDGVFLSNGPGDPEPVTYAVETVRQLIGKTPMFGICLGQQILGLALGGKTFKLKFGHRGVNQPVKNLASGRVEITSQNHGFSVDTATLNADEIEITHVNLNDGTLEGLRHRTLPLRSVQYHPEASPGPHDARYLFQDFVEMMQKEKEKPRTSCPDERTSKKY